MRRLTDLTKLCVAIIAVAGLYLSNLRAADSNDSVDAITISIDKDANVAFKVPGMTAPRVFHGAEVLNLLSTTPSITAKTKITLSPDRDVPDGIISIVKQSLYIKGQQPIEVVFSDKGDEVVVVVVSNSSDCKIIVGHAKSETTVACVKLMELLKERYPDRARTNVSILPLNTAEDEYSLKLSKEIVSAGFKFGGISRVGFVTEPQRDHR